MNIINMFLCSLFVQFAFIEANRAIKKDGKDSNDLLNNSNYDYDSNSKDFVRGAKSNNENRNMHNSLHNYLHSERFKIVSNEKNKLKKNDKSRKKKNKIQFQRSNSREENSSRTDQNYEYFYGGHLKHPFDIYDSTADHNKFYFPVHTFGRLFGNEVDGSKSAFPNASDYRKPHLGDGEKVRLRHSNPHRGMKKLIIRTHNILRGKVSPPAKDMLAMSWNTAAADQAQKWADECRPGAETDHPSVRWTPAFGSCGQNVHVAFKKKRWGRVVRLWWNERKFFRYGHSGNNLTKVGQYTQMAWYNSHKVGCGFSHCGTPSGKNFYRYVCNYCPTGNDPRRLSQPYTQGHQCESCPSSCRSVCNGGNCKLCTNSCPYSDLWINCESLARKWKRWLCNTKTKDGVTRFKNCRATCQCQDKIT